MAAIEHELATARGARLFAQAWEAGSPRAALALVHGLGEHSGRYPHLVETLLSRGISVYACDHLGHGRSSGARGAIARWDDLTSGVAALTAWAGQACPGRPLLMFGHSLGGLIALDYATERQDGLRALAISAPGLSADGISPVLRLASRLLSVIAPGLALQTGLPVTGISRDAQVQAAYRSDPLVHSVGTPRLATESFAAIRRVLDGAPSLRLPLLMVHGEADPIVPQAASAAYFQRAGSADKRYISYPGVMHEPHNDLGWERAVADVGDWLGAHVR